MIDTNNLNKKSLEYDVDFKTMSEELSFNGLTLKDWAIKFLVEIPDNINQIDLIHIYKKMDNLYTVAHNNNLIAYGIFSLCKRDLDKLKTTEYVKIYNDPTKKATAVQAENFVNYTSETLEDKYIISKFIYEFWQEQLKYLDKKSKILENINWALKNVKEIY